MPIFYRFDLAVVDGLCFYRCLTIVTLLLGDIPFVTSVTIVEPWLLGIPALPSAFPTPFSELASGTSHCLTFFFGNL
jgi:hypothetical protein